MAKSGRLIVKVEENTAHNLIGQALIDNKGSRIGKIIELIGSVKSPYASVMLTSNSKYTVGGKVYRSPSFSHQNKSSIRRNKTRRRNKA
jgi:rRNA processing protein Gar1